MVVPTSFWFTGVSIVRASTEDALSYCLPMLVAPHAARFWLSRGAIMPLGAQVAPLLLAPGRIAAGVAVLFGRREPTFFVTPKGVERRSARVHGPTLIWTASLLLALVASVIYRCSTPWSNPTAHTFLLWNAAATGLLSMLLWLAILSCIERPRYRKAERYRHRGPVLLRVEGVERECVLHDLSVSGARISLLCGAQLTDNSTLALSPELDVPVRIVRRTPSDEIGLQFLPTPEQEATLIHFVLCSSAYVPQPERWSWWNFCTIVVCRALGFRASPLDLRTDRLA
jgi:cellulose synthase (UDP-forming)